MGGGTLPLRALAGACLLTFLYFGCVLDRDGLLDSSTGTPGGVGTGGSGAQGGIGGIPTTGGGGIGGIPTTGGGGTGGVLIGGGGAGGGPLPSDVGNCILWLRADLGVNDVAGEAETWANQCVSGQDATQPDMLRRPALEVTAGPGGTPALDFARGDADHMQLNLSSSSNDYTLYAVIDQRSPTVSSQGLLTASNMTGEPRWFLLVDPPGGGNFVAVNDGNSYLPCIAPVAGPQWLAWEVDATTTTMSCQRHDGQTGSFSWGGTWLWSGQPLLGSFTAGSHHIDALVSEVILYDAVLAPADKQLIEGYLLDRYGL